MSMDVAALVQALRQDPAQRDALRGALGWGDLDVRGALAELAQAQTRTEQRLDQLAQAQQRTEQRLDQLAHAQQRTEDVVRSLVNVISGMNDRLGRLDGDALERTYREKGHAYLSRVARRLRLVDHNTLSPMIDDAWQAGTLSRLDADSLIQVDAVFSGRRHEDREPVHLVVEASVTVGRYDLRRARERAALLERFVGTPVLAVAAGEMAPREVIQAAREEGVWLVLNGTTRDPADDPEDDA